MPSGNVTMVRQQCASLVPLTTGYRSLGLGVTLGQQDGRLTTRAAG